MEDVLKVETGAGITQLSLNRPQKRNALNKALIEALIREFEKAKEQRVVILSGVGPVFCSGLDLSEEVDKGDILAKLYSQLHYSHFVTIAAVQGAVLAGGMGLMAACDLVVAHPETKFGIPELQRGLIPAQVLTFLIRQIPLRSLKEMLYLGEMIESAKAERIGLITKIDSHPHEAALELAQHVLKGAPAATKKAKALLHIFDSTFPQDLIKGLTLHRDMFGSAESKEGIQAFLEKREPKW